MVTNPYPSPISWNSIYTDGGNANMGDSYTLWDAEQGTRGGFVTVDYLGNTSVSSAATVNIQPGQAFFVQTTNGTAPVLTIKESFKTSVNSNGIYGPQSGPMATFGASLYFTDANGFRQVADGVKAIFDNSYSSTVDSYDAVEINNWDENIAILREGKHLAIEKRADITAKDTIPIFMNNMRQMGYEFQFDAGNFSDPALAATLVDNFTGIRSPLSVSGTTVVPFTVNSTAGSFATNRFMVVFAPPAGPLPVTLSSFKAKLKKIPAAQAGQPEKQEVQLEWVVQSETDLDHYEVERSTNATNFSLLVIVRANGSSNITTYNTMDPSPVAGLNYYRLKMVDRDGHFVYSQVIVIRITESISVTTSIKPNPFTNTLDVYITLPHITPLDIRLIDLSGHIIYSKSMKRAMGFNWCTITGLEKLPAGIYFLQVISDDNVVYDKLLKQ